MYFQSEIRIVPSGESIRSAAPPTKAFGRVRRGLRRRRAPASVQRQTFAALSMLQQLNCALRRCAVDDVVRLRLNDHDIYHDTDRVEHDLEAAIERFEDEVTERDSLDFETLALVVEHRASPLSWVVALRVRRTHPVGEAPVELCVNGYLDDFQLGPDFAVESLQAKIAEMMTDRERFSAVSAAHRQVHERFVQRLVEALETGLDIAKLTREDSVCVIRPHRPVMRAVDIPESAAAPPLFQGHRGIAAGTLYAWLWSAELFRSGRQFQNCRLVDESGGTILEAGTVGFRSDEFATLDPTQPFERPRGIDLRFGPAVKAYAPSGRQRDPSIPESISDRPQTRSAFDVGGLDWDGGDADGGGGDSSGCGGGCGGD